MLVPLPPSPCALAAAGGPPRRATGMASRPARLREGAITTRRVRCSDEQRAAAPAPPTRAGAHRPRRWRAMAGRSGTGASERDASSRVSRRTRPHARRPTCGDRTSRRPRPPPPAPPPSRTGVSRHRRLPPPSRWRSRPYARGSRPPRHEPDRRTASAAPSRASLRSARRSRSRACWRHMHRGSATSARTTSRRSPQRRRWCARCAAMHPPHRQRADPSPAQLPADVRIHMIGHLQVLALACGSAACLLACLPVGGYTQGALMP